MADVLSEEDILDPGPWRNVMLYSNVLKTLGQRLKDEESVHSAEALDLAEELQDSSEEIFEKIHDLLPKHEKYTNSVSFMQRIAWVFRKSRVDYVVGQLDSLKATFPMNSALACVTSSNCRESASGRQYLVAWTELQGPSGTKLPRGTYDQARFL